MPKLTDHQKSEYRKFLAQMDAVCVLASAGFPGDDYLRIETRNPMPKGAFAAHYSFFQFLSDAGRLALSDSKENGNG